jgi:hypothetical protein
MGRKGKEVRNQGIKDGRKQTRKEGGKGRMDGMKEGRKEVGN